MLAVTLTTTVGCGTDTDGGSRVERIDSAGREIVTSAAPAWGADDAWRVAPEPAVSIGVVEGEDAYQLFRVSDVLRLDDGRIVVANAGTREVRVFDVSGRHLVTVGGPGEGPAELGYPAALLPGPDGGFTVVDRMDLVHFDARGGFVERDTFDRQAWMELVGPLGPSEGGRPLRDGRVLAPIYGSGFSNQTPRPGPPFRPEITVVIADVASESVDTLTRIGGIRQQYLDVGPRPTPFVGPFAPSGTWIAGHDGTVVVHDGDLAQVERVEADGRHRIFRWRAEPEPITAAELAAWKERQRNASWARDRLPVLERGWAMMDPPTTKARVTDTRPSRDGSTWVRTSPSAYEAVEDARWQVFDAEGVWLGSVALPGAFTPYDIGATYLLGVERDPVTELETVRMLTLEGSTARARATAPSGAAPSAP